MPLIPNDSERSQQKYINSISDLLKNISKIGIEAVLEQLNALFRDDELPPSAKINILLEINHLATIWPHVDDKAIKSLLDWLLDMLTEKHISHMQVLQLLSKTDDNTSNLAQTISAQLDDSATQKLIALIRLSIGNPMCAQEIGKLICTPDESNRHQQGWAIGHYIALYHNTETNRQFIDLLLACKQNEIEISDFFEILFNEEYDETECSSYMSLMLTHHDIKLNFHLITSNLLPEWQYAEYVKYQPTIKEELINHINQLDFNAKLNALSDAKDSQQPLGMIFWARRGTRDTSPERGTLKTIQEMYNELISERHRNFSIFKPAITQSTEYRSYPIKLRQGH